ncbi:unnamed protein product [Dicrocoelium dendriticum]|nr:unnamed protein product [Dicrocoelium dendriticum]
MLGSSINEHYVRLSEDVTTFEPMDQINGVFFDPPKQQLFSVKARGAMGVTVKNPNHSETLNFCIEDRGEVLCIKFSTGNKVLGIQRKSNSVDFLNFVDGVPDGGEYSQQCKGKSAHLLGFVWCVSLEVLFVTSEQLELYQVFPSKGNLRLLKQIALSSCWFAWDFASHIIVCCTGGSTVLCQAFQLGSSNSISKLGKFELPTGPAINSPEITAFLQNHCLLTTVYGHPYFFLVSRDAESSARGETTTVVNMYRIYNDGSTDLTDILLVNSDGPIAINLVDNLILVHTQPERTDCVFDIALAYRVQNKTIRHHPVVYPKSIAPLILASSSVPLLVSNVGDTIPVELYSADWVTNLPNVVIDGRLGCLWTLQVDIDVLWRLIEKRMDVVDLLLSRANGKQCILEYCRELALESIEDAARYDSVPSNDYTFCGTGLAARLDDFAYVFKRLAEVSRRSQRTGSYACAVPSEETNDESVPPVSVPKQSSVPDEEPSILSKPHRPFTVQQSEVYTNVFLVAQGIEDKHVRSFFYAVLVEYMRSLMECDIPIENK